jgi:DNA-binding transcriptional regulator YiaG
MPVAIAVFDDGTIPAILAEDDAGALVRALRALRPAPSLSDEAAARLWLAGLPPPSGWFADSAEARAHLAAIRAEEAMPPAELAAIRAALGLTRAAFGAAIGYQGNDNTRHKQVWEMERGEKPIPAAKARAARALAASARLDPT